MNMKTFSVNVVSQMCQSVTLCQKKRFFFQKLSPSYRKVIKKLSQKLSQKLSKSCKKVVKKLSKSCQKVVKKLQKVGHFMCHGKPLKRKNQLRWRGWGGVGGGNSNSKAFGISYADRPKAKKVYPLPFRLKKVDPPPFPTPLKAPYPPKTLYIPI
jgi:hypothetical protein